MVSDRFNINLTLRRPAPGRYLQVTIDVRQPYAAAKLVYGLRCRKTLKQL